jgi:hypothetical protein
LRFFSPPRSSLLEAFFASHSTTKITYL